jgi:hypothetical protein
MGTTVGAQLQYPLFGKEPVLPDEREPAAKLAGTAAVRPEVIAAAQGRLRSILCRGGIGSSGWTAVTR